MTRSHNAQLNLELPEPSPRETAPPRRLRKAEPRHSWRERLVIACKWALRGGLAAGAVVAAYQFDQFLASDARFVLPLEAAQRIRTGEVGVQAL